MSPGPQKIPERVIQPCGPRRQKWHVPASEVANNTHNPIRSIVENLRLEPNPDKCLIALSIGDPTVFGNLKPDPEVISAVIRSLESAKYNGYAPSTGYVEAREAVAKYSSHQGSVSAQDVILCSGCSCALDLCITALANPGDNILIPRPGFSIYRTLAEGLGIKIKYYNLLPEERWQVDLVDLASQIDDRTAALIINNPSNPCGSVYTARHLQAMLEIASTRHVPIIADEIYEHFVFPGCEFVSLSSLSSDVPILSCGGLTKRFLVPGWRMGWIIIHDRGGIFKDIRDALQRLSQRIIGSNTLVQGALPDILENTPDSFFEGLVDTLHNHAVLAYSMLSSVPGLRPVMPQGAMYMMIGLDMDHFSEYDNELHFVQELVKEQSVFCLPGQCFDYPDYIRIVLTVPEEMIREACMRIAEFCEKHYSLEKHVHIQLID